MFVELTNLAQIYLNLVYLTTKSFFCLVVCYLLATFVGN